MASPFSSQLLLTLIFLLFSSASPLSSPSTTPLALKCSPSLQNPQSNNTRTLLEDLTSKISSTRFTISTIGPEPDRLHALIQCRPDLSSTTCIHCVQSAKDYSFANCPNSNAITVWFDNCYLHYYHYPIFTHQLQVFLTRSNRSNVLGRTGFEPALNLLLLRLRAKIGLASHHGFATGETYYGDGGRIFALVECLYFVTPQSCETCIELGIMKVFKDCGWNEGGVVIAGSCLIRFETYPFFDQGRPESGGSDSGGFYIANNDSVERDGYMGVKVRVAWIWGIGFVCLVGFVLGVWLLRRKIISTKGERYERQLEKLKEDVRCLLKKVDEPFARLKFIDALQRLGVGYHFKNEIKDALSIISMDDNNARMEDDLYATALRFRLLRQHGFEVSQDVFHGFMDEKGNLMASLCEDIKGMLSLYEASYLGFEGEIVLDEAKVFTIRHLNDFKEKSVDQNLKQHVEHALELPFHWRMPRLEARWYIEFMYHLASNLEDMNPLLFELAKLDYKMVQAIYQTNIKAMSRWWRDLGLGKHLSFARDRWMECFLWVLGTMSKPEFGRNREVLTKVTQLTTTIDDVYDLYGSIEELELFTDIVDRWIVNSLDQLPDYMKICFLALFNEMAYKILNELGLEITWNLKKLWADLCKAYLVEAKWYFNGYTPTLDEYLSNAWISISGPVVLAHAYLSAKTKITKDALDCIQKYSNLLRWSSMILRLWDDWGTSTDELERGDVPKSIQCYMHETGAPEEVAREHIRGLISDTWKKLNKDSFSCSLPESLINAALDLARMSQCYYEFGDEFGSPNNETKERFISLLVEPILV
ncbi:alpha-terpineol synthase, chloroplastic-like [Tasmannia lanceolata]|uniref:alpha-terpineol synthase, chloroplastic-like n=1 Tax=Tasmannia lanceolata TaxID=3420 RepID=UPI0040645694